MAIYHTLDDVRMRLPKPLQEIGPNTDPSDLQVRAWMDQVESLVESQLSARYELPITGSDAVGLIRSVCADLTAARVWRHRTVGTADPQPPRFADILEERAREIVKAIASGTLILSDQTQKPSPDRPLGTFPEEPLIRRDAPQW